MLVFTLASWQTIKALKTKQRNWRQGMWLFYLTFAPPLLLFVFSQWRPIFIERALLASSAIFCLWLAWILICTQMPGFVRYTTIVLLFFAALIGLYQHITYNGFPYAPFEDISMSLEENNQTGDVIIHSSKLTLLPTIFYAPELIQLYIADPSGGGNDTLAPATRNVLGLSSQQDIATATVNANRISLVIFQKAIDEYEEIGYASHPHLEWLFANYKLQEMNRWGDISVYRFIK